MATPNQYANVADVMGYYGMLNFAQLTTNSGSAADPAIINTACIDQSSFMDGYLGGRYPTPILGPSNVRDVLRIHCIRLVLYTLFQGRLMAEQYISVTTDRDITIKWLESVAANKASIPGQSIPGVPGVVPLSGGLIGGGMEQVFGDGQILGSQGNAGYPFWTGL